MSDELLFLLAAVTVLLLTPGPTNAVMALASAQGGIRRVARLLPAELCGYATTVLPLAWLGHDLMLRWPGFALLLKVAAASWILYLASRLWRSSRCADRDQGVITAPRVYLTTMLNPKALIVGLLLLPSPEADDFLAKLAVFALLVTGAALTWGVFGRVAAIGLDAVARSILLPRAAAIWLAAVSAFLMTNLIWP